MSWKLVYDKILPMPVIKSVELLDAVHTLLSKI